MATRSRQEGYSAIDLLIVQSRGMTLAQIGVLLAVYSLTIVLLEIPTGELADAVGRKQVALLAFIFNGIGRALSSGALMPGLSIHCKRKTTPTSICSRTWRGSAFSHLTEILTSS